MPLPTRSGPLALFVAACLGASAFSGCTSDSRKDLQAAELTALIAADDERTSTDRRESVQKLVARVAARYDRYLKKEGPEPVVDLLALSGGGDFGAFAAGVLVGWGAQRPDFDGVTGVSTGALIAPFAFIGTDEACNAVEHFYRDPREDWIRDRGLLFFLPSNPSFMEIPGLQRDLRTAVGDKIITQMAAESEKGKILLIAATNLDTGQQRAWEAGRSAAQCSASGDCDQLQKILLASSAIPAVFPPVEIDGFLYADGGVTANVLLRLDAHSPEGFLATWRREHPEWPVPKVRYWIIVSNQTRAPASIVQPRWPKVVSPSLATAIRSATFAEIRWLASEANYTNCAFGTNIEVRSLAIPDDWRPPVKGDFKKETMVSLSDLGRKLGADINSWKVWTKDLGGAKRALGDDPAEPGRP